MTPLADPVVPRVVVVVDALHLNGAVKIAVDLAGRWAGAGAVLVALKSIAPEDRIGVPPGVRLRHLAPGPRLRWWRAPIEVLRLTRIAAHADVVLIGSEIGPGLVLGWLAARLARRPVVIGVHADLDDALEEWIQPRRRSLTRWLHRRADGVVCVEAALVEPVVRNGVPEDRVRVVTNGVDVQAVRAAALGRDRCADVPGPRVVLTGRLAPQKGTDLMIRAHAAVVREVPHRVLLLNDGPDLASLRSLALELGVQDTVLFLGRVPPHPTVSGADVFCLPSRHEGLPLALLEAIALGVPCIAADSSAGVRDALDDGRAGGLLPVGDVDALAAALRAHLLDPTALRAAAERATRRLDRFDIATMTRGWAAVLEEVVVRGAR